MSKISTDVAVFFIFISIVGGGFMGSYISHSYMGNKVKSGEQFIVNDATHKCVVTNRLIETYGSSDSLKLIKPYPLRQVPVEVTTEDSPLPQMQGPRPIFDDE